MGEVVQLFKPEAKEGQMPDLDSGLPLTFDEIWDFYNKVQEMNEAESDPVLFLEVMGQVREMVSDWPDA